MRFRHAATNVIVVIAVFMGSAFAQDGEAGPTSIEGYWQGPLKVRADLDITMVFHVSARPDGTLVATMDVPIQQIKDLPVDTVSYEQGRLRLDIRAVQGVFEGSVDETGSIATGEWTQGPRTIPLRLKRSYQAPEPVRRPQEPERPYPYDEEEVSYDNKAAGIRLNATLTLPRATDPVPAVVLITGGGAQDRDQTILGHKPFWVLADYLTRRGVAVLRADDRGLEEINGPLGMQKFLEWTSEDFAGDALAGVEYLETRKEIDPKRIGLIGHSEGGLVAPLAAVRSSDVAFIVMLAGPGQTTEEAHHDQCGYILKDAGASDKIIKLAREHYVRAFSMLRNEKDNAVAKQKLRKMERDMRSGLSKQEKDWIALLDRSMAGNPTAILTPWLRNLLSYDPQVTLAKVTCPVLALAAEKDWQVPSDRHLPLIRQALETGGQGKFTARILPRLNHLFQTCETGSPREYASIEETFSPVALKVVGDWILEQVDRAEDADGN